MLETLPAKAHHVLADNPRIVLTNEQWKEFEEMLDSPVVDMDKLKNLMQSPSVFTDE